MALYVFDVFGDYGSLESIKALLVDNISVNKGKKGLSCEVGKQNLHTVECALYQNELPFQSLFKKLDGATSGPQNFNGPLEKQCKTNCHNQQTVQFKPIENPMKTILVAEEVLNDLSTDQRLLHEYTKGIGVGEVDQKYACWKIGLIHHVRWLTLTTRLLAVYSREKSPSENLTKLVHCIVKVIAPNWFAFKSSSKLHESSRILFQSISRLQQLPYEDIKQIVKQNL